MDEHKVVPLLVPNHDRGLQTAVAVRLGEHYFRREAINRLAGHHLEVNRGRGFHTTIAGL